MFELMHPQKDMVGKRIRMVKKELEVSFAELGKRLGLSKSTINSYAQGYTLAPAEVIEQLAKITGKSVAWFYFGEMEDYIRDYLVKKGHEALLLDYKDLPARLKKEFLHREYSSWTWKNEFGYPCEESMDDLFFDVYNEIMLEYITSVTQKYIEEHFSCEPKKKLQEVSLIADKVYECFEELHDFKYGDKDEIEKLIDSFYKCDIKEENIMLMDENLAAKFIDILQDDAHIKQFISELFVQLTGKDEIGNTDECNNLINIFRTMRSELIKLYKEQLEK